MAGLGRIRRSKGARVKRWLALAVACCTLLPDTAMASERKFLMGSFKDIIILGDMQVQILTDKAPSAKASGDFSQLDLLRIDRVGTTLTIRLQNPVNNVIGRRVNEPLVITITNREVRNIALRGNAKVTISAMRQDLGAKIGIAGGGDVQISTIAADSLNADISGNGSIHILGGSIRSVTAALDGNGTFEGSAVTTTQLKLQQDGNATSNFTVQDKAEISNTGAGNITVAGKATCLIRKAGAANIKCAHLGKDLK